MGRIIPAAGGGGLPATASVNAISNQLYAGSVTLSLTSSGVPSAHLWTVNGVGDGVSDQAAATPTFTFEFAGWYTIGCVATIDGQSVVASTYTFRLGDGLGLVYPLTLSVDAIDVD